MGEKNMLSLQCVFLFWAIVLKVVKLQVIWGCSEQNIFNLVDKMFQLNINITETRTEGIKSSDGEKFSIFKLKLA